MLKKMTHSDKTNVFYFVVLKCFIVHLHVKFMSFQYFNMDDDHKNNLLIMNSFV